MQIVVLVFLHIILFGSECLLDFIIRKSIISVHWWNDPKVEESSNQVFTKW